MAADKMLVVPNDLLTFARCAGSSLNTAEWDVEHDTPLVGLAI
jgi:hypothetical protein